MQENSAPEPILPVDVIIPVWGEAYAQNLPVTLASVANAARKTVVGDEYAMRHGLAHGATHALPLLIKHPGPGRVQGLRASDQPYVLFIDADDELLPGALARLVAELEARPKHVGVAGYFQRSTDGSHWPKPHHARLGASVFGMHALMFRNMLPAHGSVLLRRSLLPQEGLFTPVMNEDWHGVLRMLARGRIAFLHEPVLKYAIADGSMSRSVRVIAELHAANDSLISTAEEALGRIAPTLRLADLIARSYRRRTVHKILAREAKLGHGLKTANIDYS